jgi:hypothetical protein
MVIKIRKLSRTNSQAKISFTKVIKENNAFISRLKELCDRLNSTFSNIKFYTYEDEDDGYEPQDRIMNFKTLVILGEFSHAVVQKSSRTQEDITIGGVMITYETNPPQMIPMTEDYFRDDLEIVSSLPIEAICAYGHVLQDKCAFGNFLENQEDFDELSKKINDIREINDIQGSSVH